MFGEILRSAQNDSAKGSLIVAIEYDAIIEPQEVTNGNQRVRNMWQPY